MCWDGGVSTSPAHQREGKKPIPAGAGSAGFGRAVAPLPRTRAVIIPPERDHKIAPTQQTLAAAESSPELSLQPVPG